VITVHSEIGRVIEVRIESPAHRGEWDAFAKGLPDILQRMPKSFMYCADVSRATLLAPEEAESAKDIMRKDNPRLIRTAIYLGDNSSLMMMQMERIIRETNNPARKTFRDLGKLLSWMSEVTTPGEQERINRFYRGDDRLL
jgi:hypothetical protein